jgi:hypothetical protein
MVLVWLAECHCSWQGTFFFWILSTPVKPCELSFSFSAIPNMTAKPFSFTDYPVIIGIDFGKLTG